MSGEESADETGKWPGILICVPCESYVDADGDSEKTACDHTWAESTDISDFSDEQWAKFRHDVLIKELERDNPRNRHMLVSELSSLMYDLVMADVLPEDYDNRDGLEKLLVVGESGGEGP